MTPKKVFVIAEAGVNHNGSLARAKEMVLAACEAGADAVKFQTFKSENLTRRSAPLADYQKKNAPQESSQRDMLKKLELSFEQHLELKGLCEKSGILFFSTAFDLESLDALSQLGLRLFKVPSGEITNLPYLEKMAALADQVIISTGMSTLDEVKEAVGVFLTAGRTKEQLTVLHCNTEYPTPFEDVHLRAMKAMGDQLGVSYGYSDHTLGIEVSVAAVALGATVIEKHFTLDRDLPGPDHKASLTPAELQALVSSIRHIELALGSDEKKPSPSELKNRSIARKSIVAARPIREGELFTAENLTTKRPGDGISPMLWHQLLQTKASRNYNEDDLI